jgi:hypothetical protein
MERNLKFGNLLGQIITSAALTGINNVSAFKSDDVSTTVVNIPAN